MSEQEKKQSSEEINVLQVKREMEKREKSDEIRRRSEYQKKAAEAEDKKKEEYQKKLQNDKLEMIKAKQGLSEGIKEDEEGEKKHYNLWERWCSFFYRNKGMVILGAVFIFIAGFLTYDFLSKVEPDMTLMVLVYDTDIELVKDNFEDMLSEYIDDLNGDRKVKVTVFYMPIDEENVDPYTLQASSAKLFAFMQEGDDLLVIADSKVDDVLQPQSVLYRLEDDHPDNPLIRDYGFYFSKTKLLEDIGYKGQGSDDYYIGIRKVKNGSRYKEKMQKNFDIYYDVLNRIIEKYSADSK